MAINGRKWVMLDRDGTIIVNKHYQKDPGDTELLPLAREGLALLRERGYSLVVVSNQSGIARGLLTVEDAEAVNRAMITMLDLGEEIFDRVYFCPHVPMDACTCRKPATGMAELAAGELGLSLRDAYVIGDSAGDIQFGENAGAVTILVRTGNGAETERDRSVKPDFVANTLLEAAQWIIGREGEKALPHGQEA